MNIYKPYLFGILLLFPVIGCSDQAQNPTTQKSPGVSKNAVAEMSRKTTILQSGDVLVLSKNTHGKPVASYISTNPADKQVIAKRIIQILKDTQANKSFLEFVETSLPENRVLKKENFILPLVDVDGTEYRFTYSSNMEYSLYFMNYEFVAAK